MLALSAHAHQFKILLGRIDSLAQADESGMRTQSHVLDQYCGSKSGSESELLVCSMIR